MGLANLEPPLTSQLDWSDPESRIVRNMDGDIITFESNPIDAAVEAVREAQDSAGKGIWEQ